LGGWVRYIVVSEHFVSVGNRESYKVVMGPIWEARYITKLNMGGEDNNHSSQPPKLNPIENTH